MRHIGFDNFVFRPLILNQLNFIFNYSDFGFNFQCRTDAFLQSQLVVWGSRATDKSALITFSGFHPVIDIPPLQNFFGPTPFHQRLELKASPSSVWCKALDPVSQIFCQTNHKNSFLRYKALGLILTDWSCQLFWRPPCRDPPPVPRSHAAIRGESRKLTDGRFKDIHRSSTRIQV